MTDAGNPSALDGVRYGTVSRASDPRGSFRELWRASAYGSDTRFVQANLSGSSAGVRSGRRGCGWAWT